VTMMSREKKISLMILIVYDGFFTVCACGVEVLYLAIMPKIGIYGEVFIE